MGLKTYIYDKINCILQMATTIPICCPTLLVQHPADIPDVATNHLFVDRVNLLQNMFKTFREFIVLTMTTAAMYSMPINSLDVWAMATLVLTKIWTTDPLPTIPHQLETQFIASQTFPVSVSGLIPSLSAALVPCWFRKCPNQAMVTQLWS